MKIVVLHDSVGETATQDELDTLVQQKVVSDALSDLGHQPVAVPFSFDITGVMNALRNFKPDLVFNLVESVAGQGPFVCMAPAILDSLRLPYTGSHTDTVFLTSNKIAAKRILKASGISTPPWLSADQTSSGLNACEGPFIIKSLWEHASIGLGQGSVVHAESLSHLRREMDRRREQLRGECFAEAYIEGREFNLSLLASGRGPEVLPPAEIQFVSFPLGTARIVDYDAKWNSDSFAYHHTPRSFDFPDEDKTLLRQLTSIARKCWDIFALRGYGRVDFRVDAQGNPWVLEVNANPCISPDSGFVAAAERRGLRFSEIIERILGDALAAPTVREPTTIGPTPTTETKRPKSPSARRRKLPGSCPSVSAESITYRNEVRQTDLESIRDIVESSGFFSAEEVEVAVQLAEERLAKGAASGYEFLFAQQEGDVIGYACFGLIPATAASYELYWIAVHNRFRRAGIGKSLLAKAEREIVRLGGRRIYLDTSSRAQYEPTRAFYRSHGYQQEAILKDFYSSGDAKIVFVKEINPAKPDDPSEKPHPRGVEPRTHDQIARSESKNLL
jgi:D-alanine-D-alanine ligase